MQLVRETLAGLELDGLIAIGGEDTLGVANKLHQGGVNPVDDPADFDERRPEHYAALRHTSGTAALAG